MKRIISASIASVLALASLTAQACGDVLFRVGHGMRYDSYIAPHPAAVLLYTRGGGESTGKEAALRKGLEKAGHTVTVRNVGESLVPDAGARPATTRFSRPLDRPDRVEADELPALCRREELVQQVEVPVDGSWRVARPPLFLCNRISTRILAA